MLKNLLSADTKACRLLQVLVTGAAGRTGKIVLKKLLNHDFYAGFGLVRTKQVRYYTLLTYTDAEPYCPGYNAFSTGRNESSVLQDII